MGIITKMNTAETIIALILYFVAGITVGLQAYELIFTGECPQPQTVYTCDCPELAKTASNALIEAEELKEDCTSKEYLYYDTYHNEMIVQGEGVPFDDGYCHSYEICKPGDTII